MEAVRVRHISLPAEEQAQNRDGKGMSRGEGRAEREGTQVGGRKRWMKERRAMLILARPQWRWTLVIRGVAKHTFLWSLD